MVLNYALVSCCPHTYHPRPYRDICRQLWGESCGFNFNLCTAPLRFTTFSHATEGPSAGLLLDRVGNYTLFVISIKWEFVVVSQYPIMKSPSLQWVVSMKATID